MYIFLLVLGLAESSLCGGQSDVGDDDVFMVGI